MNKVEWSTYADTDIDSYNVYRSIPGITIPFPNTLAVNDQLIFAATSPDVQKISFPAIDIDSFVATINQNAKGLVATKSQDATKVYLRLTAFQNPRLKLYSCTALQSLGIQPQVIVPGMNWTVISNLPWVNTSIDYEYDDVEGDIHDLYYVTSVKGVTESLPSIIKGIIPDNATLCWLEARFVDPQGRPVQNVFLRATLYVPQQDSTTVGPITTYSDAYGRVSLPLTQGQQYLIEIPAIGYNEVVDVPAVTFANLLSLPATLKHLFSPFGDPT